MPGLLVLLICLAGASADSAETPSWWSEAELGPALSQAGTNRQELLRVLEAVPASQRDGARFLLTNLPPRDLESLSADFLLTDLALAYRAWAEAPWAKDLPTDLFLNDVLPYASVDEPREDWRPRLHGVCAPLVRDCRTPSDAAQRLNQRLFGLLKVRYSLERRRPSQGPLETIETGVATCTGLSILLVDACRSVGVPARVVGTRWATTRGNHTWVEIWDGGWHFLGAAEPDPNGLDRGWFVGNAAQAPRNDPDHAIYASSFRRTGCAFPLAWAPTVGYVSAVDVTERYAPNGKPADLTKMRLLVRVLDRPAGRRVAARVVVTDSADGAPRFEATSKDESADMNDDAVFTLAKGRTYRMEASLAGTSRRQFFTSGTNSQELLTVYLDGIPPLPAFSIPDGEPRSARKLPKPLKPAEAKALQQALSDFFAAPTNRQATWQFDRGLERLLLRNEPAVRRAAWEAFCAAPIHGSLRADFEGGQVRFGRYLSPFTARTVGTRPTNGWALFIAMHGGGGAPKQVNDSQWQVMQRYYRDHPEVGGYHYVALRAPNDEWNGFYADYVYPLIASLIRQFLLFADTDPNKVFILGYSHGGYGAFAIGPKMPDRFAAIHASAAAPTDGETTARTLRNTVFTCMVGERDTMYGRLERVQRFGKTIQELRGTRTDIYPVAVQIIPGNGHTGLPDRDKIADLYPAVRNPVPRELTWLMTDGVIRDFFWLHTPAPGKGMEIDATCRNNRLTVTTTTNVTSASVLLDNRLVDLKKAVTLDLNGKTRALKLRPSLRTLGQTLLDRGDPDLAFTTEIVLPTATSASSK